ncbi:hypothetical protein QFC21_002707 [Naganishia friedmannii]|uniref:Uncharacterized protein n=1 Tax=Naganishia friedmannii TaxID=89922 RepID=A0ACC2VV13_9TREE|nr:hypothetical protein QFC21_002707 [Naganishia friedmannii]
MDKVEDDSADDDEDDAKEPLFPPSPPGRRTRLGIGDATLGGSLNEGLDGMSVSERLGEALATDIGLPFISEFGTPATSTTRTMPVDDSLLSHRGTTANRHSIHLGSASSAHDSRKEPWAGGGSRILVKKPLPSNADRLKATQTHKRRGSKASWTGFSAFWSTSTPTTPPSPIDTSLNNDTITPSPAATTTTTTTRVSHLPAAGGAQGPSSSSCSRPRSGSVFSQHSGPSVKARRTFEPAASKTEPVVGSHAMSAHGVGTRGPCSEQRAVGDVGVRMEAGSAAREAASSSSELGQAGDGKRAAWKEAEGREGGDQRDIDRLVPFHQNDPAAAAAGNIVQVEGKPHIKTPLSSSESPSAESSSKESTRTVNSTHTTTTTARSSPSKDLLQGGEARKSLLRTLSALPQALSSPTPPTETDIPPTTPRTPSQTARERVSMQGKDFLRATAGTGTGTRTGRSSSIVSSVFTSASASTDTSSGRRRSRTTTSGSGGVVGGAAAAAVDASGDDEHGMMMAVQMKAMTKPAERPPPMLLRRATAVSSSPHAPPTSSSTSTHLNGNAGNSKGTLQGQQLPSRFEAESKEVDLEPYIDRYGFVYHLKYVQMLLDLQQGLAESEMSEQGEEGQEEVVVPHTTTVTRVDPEPGKVTVGRHRSATIATFTPSPSRPTLSSADEMVTVPPPSTGTLPTAGAGGGSINIRKAKLDQLAAQYRRPLVSLLGQLAEMHDKQEHERMKKWHAFLKYRRQRLPRLATVGGQEGQGWNEDVIGVANLGDGKIGRDLMKRFLTLVHTVGIPIALRASVWAECSSAKEAFTPGEYREILAVHHADTQHPTLLEIEKDVRRTFPTNVFFGGDGVGCDKLRRCLTAYAWRDPQIGYCQGMNLIAATLLLTYDDEEQAYWTFVSIIRNMLPEDWFTPSLQGSMIEQSVINDLVDTLLPNVAAHLMEMGVEVSAITFGWILSIFANCLPIETVLRVWDCFMVEGRDVIPCTVIAILKLGEQGILACDNVEELFEYLNTITERLWTADRLVLEQFKASITSAELERRRREHLEKVTAMADGASG